MCMFVPTTFFFDPCMQLYLLNIDTLLLYYEQRGYLDVQQRSVGYADVSASFKKKQNSAQFENFVSQYGLKVSRVSRVVI